MTSPGEYLSGLFGLKGKTALVTGGTRGIGASMSLALARAGADIILVQRNTADKRTQAEIQSLGRTAEIVHCDLADSAAVERLIPDITSRGVIIDIVVNCGGINYRTDPEDFPLEEYHKVLQVNQHALFVITRDAGKHMLSTDRTGRGNGKIIQVSSVIGFQGGLKTPAYAATKHALIGLTKSFANSWSSKGINVNAIAPGYIATEMNDDLVADPERNRQISERIPAARWGASSDFEGVTVFLAGRGSDYVCGECVVVDGGWLGR